MSEAPMVEMHESPKNHVEPDNIGLSASQMRRRNQANFIRNKSAQSSIDQWKVQTLMQA